MLKVLVPLLLITGGTFGFLVYTGNTTAASLVGSGTNASSKVNVEFSVTINHQEQSFADFIWMAQMALKGQFWTPSCLFFCKGVSYYMDPTAITNEGRSLEQCFIFDQTNNGISTCNWGVDLPTYIWLSSSSNSVTATDTNAGSAGPCYSGATGVITSGGLAPAAGTVTAGTSGSTVTTTIAKTFTAGESDASVQATCLKSEGSGGSHIYIYAEGTFGPDSLVSGNTLTITWTIART